MRTLNRRQFLSTSMTAIGGAVLLPGLASADVLPNLEHFAAPLISGEEQTAQKDIWALEVRYKPVRMIFAPVTDAKTGVVKKQLVWYFAYRVVVRPSSRLPDASLNTPERPLFVPELTLIVEDESRRRSYPDRVFPEAIPLINRREKHQYKSSVDVVAPLPPITPDKSRKFTTLDGVATWTGIDPDTNYFAIEMAGFSNGYKVAIDNDNQETVTRRVVRQRFWRPSDRFNQDETEIRFKDEPEWFYQ